MTPAPAGAFPRRRGLAFPNHHVEELTSMQLRVTHQDLTAAVATVAPAVAARPTLPPLGGVRLDAADGRLRLIGTDLETTITSEIPAEVAAAGVALVPLDALKWLLGAKRPKGTAVTLRADDEQLHVGVAGARGRLRLLANDEFPAVPPAGRPLAEVPADTVRAWASVTVAASDDLARPVLGAVLLEVGPDEEVTAAATDSYRLHVQTGKAAVTEPASLLVPAGALAAVVKAAQAAESASVTVGVVDRHDVAGRVPTATFTLGASTIAVRLVEGEFPNYRTLLPDPDRGDLVVRVTDAAAAAAALKAAPKPRGSGQLVVLGLAAGAAPTLTVEERDVAAWEADLPGALVEQAPCGRVGFNFAYLRAEGPAPTETVGGRTARCEAGPWPPPTATQTGNKPGANP